MSPVLNHPSGVMAFLVASGLPKYPCSSNLRRPGDQITGVHKTHLHDAWATDPQLAGFAFLCFPDVFDDKASFKIGEQGADCANFAYAVLWREAMRCRRRLGEAVPYRTRQTRGILGLRHTGPTLG